MSQTMDDLRWGLLMLKKNCAFTAVAVLVFALGSGANTAIFSILNAVVLRPLPYSDPSRLYRIGSMTNRGQRGVSAADFENWRERTQVFEKMAAAWIERSILSGVDEPEQLHGLSVTQDCFEMLGVPPLMGRWLSSEDFRAGAAPSVVLGYDVWQRRFSGDGTLPGKLILLDGKPRTVVGIMPPLFQFDGRGAEFWIPLSFSPRLLSRRELCIYQVLARAKKGMSKREVTAEADSITRMLTAQFPEAHKGWTASVTPIAEQMVQDVRPTLLLLLGAVGFVLLIACFNIANLLLARGVERSHEIAVRIALGASRYRIIRQLLTESLLLAGLGGILGLLLAEWANKSLIAAFARRAAIPRLEQTGLDVRVLAFTLLLAVSCSLVFGLIPALHASKVSLNEMLKESGRGGNTGLGSRRLRSLLIVAETSLSLVLLVGAGLMLRSFYHLTRVNPGFKSEKVLTMNLPMPAFRVPDRKRQPAYYTELLNTVQALPGIQAAGLVTILPLSNGEAVISVGSDSKGSLERLESVRTYPFRAVSPDYFTAMGIPLLAGRAFTDADNAGAPRVAIVNELLARELWPGQNPIGRQIQLDSPIPVVGVVGNILHRGLEEKPQGELFFPYLQHLGVPQSALVVRARLDPMQMADTIRKKIRELQPDQPIIDIRTLEQLVSDSISQPRLYTLLLGIFAGLALVLASVGIYGVMSYSVAQRFKEIGIRMALGAGKWEILREIMEDGLKYVLIGLLIGLGGALAVTRLLAARLFEVKETDPATYLTVSLILVGSAIAAIGWPAHHAATRDPLAALRHQ